MTTPPPALQNIEATARQLIAELDGYLAEPVETEISLEGLDNRVDALCTAALRLGAERSALQPLMDALGERLTQMTARVTNHRDFVSSEMNRQTVRTSAFRAYTRTQR
jgi:hypothetical protein